MFLFVCFCLPSLRCTFSPQCYIVLLGVEEAERTKNNVSDDEEKLRLMKSIQRGVEKISAKLRNSDSL